MPSPKAAIFGCSGLVLTQDERTFFERQPPLGFILFARNCESPEQIRQLVADLRSTVPHNDVPVLIDQEGGRVARLRPPHWRAYPPAERFVSLAALHPDNAVRACYLNARLIAEELAALGINTNCAPVADLRLQGAHDIIGDRAFGHNAATIVPLARAQAQGLMDGGVMPVLKHIPGHGRAMVDSHESLPVVDADIETLQEDFAPFKALADLPMAMTAHVRYQSIDADYPATLSPSAIRLIREEIGFDGLLMTDDMSMKALRGDLGELSTQALAAGCDVILHCNGQMEEMQHIASMIGEMGGDALRRAANAFASLNSIKVTDVAELQAELAHIMPHTQAA